MSTVLEVIPRLETMCGSGFYFCFLPIILDSASVTQGGGAVAQSPGKPALSALQSQKEAVWSAARPGRGRRKLSGEMRSQSCRLSEGWWCAFQVQARFASSLRLGAFPY